MNDVCEGIVLKNTDYKDADALVVVLTNQYGKLTFSARGVRKMKSKNANGCNLFNKSNFYFDYKDQKTMFSLKTAESIHNYRHIREDLVKQAIAAVMMEMMEKQDVEDIVECYHILSTCLDLLEKTENPMALFGLYVAQCLQITGVNPNIDGCVQCGREDELVSISISRGGFICKNCFQSSYEKSYDRSVLKFFRLFNKAEISQFYLIEAITPCTYSDVEPLLYFYHEYSGINLKSIAFLKTVISL